MKYVWLLLIGFVLPLRAQQEQWTVYNSTNAPLPSNQINALALQDTVLWAGTSLGLVRFDGADWQVFNTVNSPLTGNYVKCLYAASYSVLWIGTTAGVTRHSGNEWISYSPSSSPLPSSDVRAITGWNGSVWIATAAGLASFNGASWTVYTTKNSQLPSDNLLSLAADAGSLWIGTDGSGLVRFDGTAWTTYTTGNSPLPSNVVMSVAVTEDNSVYAGTWDNNGLALLRPAAGQWQVFRSSDGLADGSIRALATSTCGLLWAGTRFGGLTNNRVGFRPLYSTQTSPMPHDYVLSLAARGEDVWIGTQNGLAIVDRNRDVYPRAAASYCEDREFILPFEVDGLPSCSGVFRMQLSDAAGDFTAPVPLVTASTAYPFSLTATIPAGTVPGTNYRIRLLGADTTMQGISAPFAVYPTPEPVLSSAEVIHLCGTDSVQLDPGAFASYRWSTGETERSITVRQAGVYSVTVTSPQGCSAVSPSVRVETHELPQPAITMSGPTTFCPGDSVVLTAGSFAQYQWSNGSTAATLVVRTAGSYSVTVTDEYGCTATAEPVQFSTYPQPQKPSITNINNTLYSSPALGYQWLRNGQTIDGATDRLYKPEQSGAYSVTTRDINFCNATSEPYTIAIVGVEHGPGSPGWTVAQDGNDGILITGFAEQPSVVHISVVDLLGNIVATRRVEAQSAVYERLSLAPFAAEFYLVVVRLGEEVVTVRSIRR